MVKESFFQFTNSLSGPRAGMENVHGFSRQAEVHRSHGELHAAAALDENDGVVIGDPEKIPKLLFGGRVDAFKFGRAVAHLHDGHAAPAPVEELLADAFEDGKRKRSRSGVEIVDALGGAGADGYLTHGVGVLFRVVFCGGNGWLALIFGFPE